MVRGCQTCLRVIKKPSEVLYISNVSSGPGTITLKEKLEDCVPEIILDSVQNSVLCHSCVGTLTLAYQFKQRCLETQQKIYDFLQQVPASTHTDIGKIAVYYQRMEKIAPVEDPTTDDPSNINVKLAEMPYSCRRCPFSCLDKCVMRQHKILHKNKAPPHKCTQCSFIFPTEVLLLEHLATHSNEQPYACTLCDFVTSSHTKFKKHGWVHRPAFQCNICWQRFLQRCDLDAHVEIHICERESKPFQCGLCEFKCDSLQTIGSHSINSHKNTYNCKTCTVKCRTQRGLMEHTTRAHKEPAEVPQTINLYENLNYHLNEDVIIVPDDERENNNTIRDRGQTEGTSKGTFVCIKCSVDFKTPGKLQDHSARCGVFYRSAPATNTNQSLFQGVNRADSASGAPKTSGGYLSNLLARAHMYRQFEGMNVRGSISRVENIAARDLSPKRYVCGKCHARFGSLESFKNHQKLFCNQVRECLAVEAPPAPAAPLVNPAYIQQTIDGSKERTDAVITTTHNQNIFQCDLCTYTGAKRKSLNLHMKRRHKKPASPPPSRPNVQPSNNEPQSRLESVQVPPSLKIPPPNVSVIDSFSFTRGILQENISSVRKTSIWGGHKKPASPPPTNPDVQPSNNEPQSSLESVQVPPSLKIPTPNVSVIDSFSFTRAILQENISSVRKTSIWGNRDQGSLLVVDVEQNMVVGVQALAPNIAQLSNASANVINTDNPKKILKCKQCSFECDNGLIRARHWRQHHSEYGQGQLRRPNSSNADDVGHGSQDPTNTDSQTIPTQEKNIQEDLISNVNNRTDIEVSMDTNVQGQKSAAIELNNENPSEAPQNMEDKGSKGYRCNLCPLSFETRYIMLSHWKDAHQRQWPHSIGAPVVDIQTTNLPQNLNTKRSLDRNIRKTAEIPQKTKRKAPAIVTRPYRCPMCLLTFSSKSTCRTHRRRAHKHVTANWSPPSHESNAQNADVNVGLVNEENSNSKVVDAISKNLELADKPKKAKCSKCSFECENLEACSVHWREVHFHHARALAKAQRLSSAIFASKRESNVNDQVTKVPENVGLNVQTANEPRNLINQVNSEEEPNQSAAGMSKKRKMQETETNPKLNINVPAISALGRLNKNNEAGKNVSKTQKSYRCRICPTTKETRVALRNHCRGAHGKLPKLDAEGKNNQDGNVIANNPVSVEENLTRNNENVQFERGKPKTVIKCKRCPFECKNRQLRDGHWRMIHSKWAQANLESSDQCSDANIGEKGPGPNNPPLAENTPAAASFQERTGSAEVPKLDEKLDSEISATEDTSTRTSKNMDTRDFPPDVEQNLKNDTQREKPNSNSLQKTTIGENAQVTVAEEKLDSNVDLNRPSGTSTTDQNSDANNPVVLGSNNKSITIPQSVAAPNLDDVKESLLPPEISKQRNKPKIFHKCKFCPFACGSRKERESHFRTVHSGRAEISLQASHSVGALESSISNPNVNKTDKNSDSLDTDVGKGDANAPTTAEIVGGESISTESVAVKRKNSDTAVATVKREKLDISDGGNLNMTDIDTSSDITIKKESLSDYGIPSTSNVKLENLGVAVKQEILANNEDEN